MRFQKVLIFTIICIICYVLVWISAGGMDWFDQIGLGKETVKFKPPEITLVVVSCGQRADETLNMIKSALIFNTEKQPLRFIIITEDNLMPVFEEKLHDWQVILGHSFNYKFLPLTFPKKNEKEWKTLFKPCASQRLFLPSLLTDVDSVLYLDTDILFLSSVVDIWRQFRNFNRTQIAALTPEHEDKNVGWYNRFARHPFYGALGINSGVMLMNLTRMREFEWEESVMPIYKEYKFKITWGDQDLINILFYYHPDKLYVLPCEWNYRPDHCMYMSVCPSPSGIRIIHGNRGYFHSDRQPIFKYIYKAIEEYRLGDDPYRHFLLPLEVALREIPVVNSNCGKVTDKFLYKARQMFIENVYDD